MFAKKKRKEKKQIFNPTISNLSRLSRKDMCQRGGLIPAVSNNGIEENDKKKTNKNSKWVILENKCERGQICNFFGIQG